LRYADDATLMAGKKEQLKVIIKKSKTESEKARMYFNIKRPRSGQQRVGGVLRWMVRR